MRIFLSSLLILAHLLCLSLPTSAAVLDRSGIGTGVRANHGVVEGSSDTIEARSWTSFLNPSYIIESIQNATHAFVAPKPAPPDFWEMAKEYERDLQDYVPRMLGNAAEFFQSAKFTDIPSTMHHIVNNTATFRDDIRGALDTHNITFDLFAAEIEGVFMAIVNDLEKIPPPDKAPGHPERTEMVDKVLDDTTLALVTLATRFGIEEEVVTTYLLALKPHVQTLIVIVGDINEQHPELLPALAFSVAILLIPESWILRPFLWVFGFGPAGPIKGSAATWLQSRLWGAAVKHKSWFSFLQKAGTGVYPKWGGFLAKLSVWVGGLMTAFHPGAKHE